MRKMIAGALALALLALTACAGQTASPSSAAEEAGTSSASASSAAAQDAPAPEDNGPNEEFTVPETDEAARVSDLTITSMATDKKTYAPGEAVTLTLDWTGTPDETCWVGLVPADIKHGDEEINDAADLAYLYLGGAEPGSFVFEHALEPGEYTLRVNETDDGGAELAWIAFRVAE